MEVNVKLGSIWKLRPGLLQKKIGDNRTFIIYKIKGYKYYIYPTLKDWFGNFVYDFELNGYFVELKGIKNE